ncbi:MAG: ABC transporter permease subunit, partial [Actinomycetota bacterium]
MSESAAATTTTRRWVKPALQFALLALGVAVAVPLLGRLDARTVSGHFETPLPPTVLGAITGLTYGLLGVGLVLVYRTNRIVNFAHGEIGAFGAAFFGIAVTRWNIPYWLAFPVALAVGGLIGAFAEMAVIRRLKNAPRVMSVVATLGVGTFLVGFAAAIHSSVGVGATYPEPSWLPTFHVGALLVGRAHTAM